MKRIFKGRGSRAKKRLFDPYENGITSYDLAYLSSKRIGINKLFIEKENSNQEDFAA